MDQQPRPRFGIRDVVWLTILALVLAAWGWDRGRLATRIDTLNPQPAPPQVWADLVSPSGPIFVDVGPLELTPDTQP